MFDAVEGAYAKGALSLGVIGMQYVGYKEGFDGRFRARYAQTPSKTEQPPSPSTVKPKFEPEDNPRSPIKRKFETGAPADPRKRAKTTASQTARPVARPVAKMIKRER